MQNHITAQKHIIEDDINNLLESIELSLQHIKESLFKDADDFLE